MNEYGVCIRLAATNDDVQIELALRLSYEALKRRLAEDAVKRYEFRCRRSGERLDFEAKPLP